MLVETISTPGNESQIVAKLRGTAIIYEDQSMEFRPDKESDRVLYNTTYANSKNGSIKRSDKSVVMRVVTDANPTDLKAELFRKTLELITKVPDEDSGKLDIPDYTEHVGDTQHSKVFLQKEGVLIQTKIRFDEENPKIAGLLAHASLEQKKYLKLYIDPEAIYQAEVAAVCLLLSDCKTKHVNDVKVQNAKPRKSTKKCQK